MTEQHTHHQSQQQLAGQRSRVDDALDDDALIDDVAAGDRDAFERLYRRYYPRLSAYLHRLLNAPDLAEETVDDVMLAVWQGARRFRKRSRLSTWIFGIAYRKGLKAMRRSSRWWQWRSVEDIPAIPVRDSHLEAPILDRLVLRSRLSSGLGSLSPEQRAVVFLTFVEGRSYQEIAKIAGCPVNTVKTRMFHARRRLREQLDDAPVDRQDAPVDRPDEPVDRPDEPADRPEEEKE